MDAGAKREVGWGEMGRLEAQRECSGSFDVATCQWKRMWQTTHRWEIPKPHDLTTKNHLLPDVTIRDRPCASLCWLKRPLLSEEAIPSILSHPFPPMVPLLGTTVCTSPGPMSGDHKAECDYQERLYQLRKSGKQWGDGFEDPGQTVTLNKPRTSYSNHGIETSCSLCFQSSFISEDVGNHNTYHLLSFYSCPVIVLGILCLL